MQMESCQTVWIPGLKCIDTRIPNEDMIECEKGESIRTLLWINDPSHYGICERFPEHNLEQAFDD